MRSRHPVAPKRQLLGPILATLAALAGFATLLGLFLVAQGVGCCDDASFAATARSLAEGRGYVVPLNYFGDDFARRPFHPELGVGPASILPVALSIKLLGPHAWVPGLTHVVLAACLLLALAALLILCGGLGWRVPLFVLVFSMLVVALSAHHFYLLFQQFGEPIAALLVLCGYAAWATMPGGRAGTLLTGLFLGLAVLTKEIAGLYVVAFVMVIAAARFANTRERPLSTADLRAVATLALSGTLLFTAFEVWKLLTLGTEGWVDHWRAHIAFIRRQSAGAQTSLRLQDHLAARADAIRSDYFPSLLFAITLTATSLLACWRYGHASVKRLALLVACGATIHLAYWILLSNGWPRYLYLAVALGCALVALPLLSRLPNSLAVAYLALLMTIPLLKRDELVPLALGATAWSVASGRATLANTAEREVLAYLDRVAPGDAVYVPSWTHAASLEYLSRRPYRFQGGASQALERGGGPIYVVVNRFVLEYGRDASELHLFSRLARCGEPVARNATYSLFRCDGHKP